MVVGLGKHTECGSHGDASVLDLHSAVVEEVLFRSSVRAVLDESQRAFERGGDNES